MNGRGVRYAGNDLGSTKQGGMVQQATNIVPGWRWTDREDVSLGLHLTKKPLASIANLGMASDTCALTSFRSLFQFSAGCSSGLSLSG